MAILVSPFRDRMTDRSDITDGCCGADLDLSLWFGRGFFGVQVADAAGSLAAAAGPADTHPVAELRARPSRSAWSSRAASLFCDPMVTASEAHLVSFYSGALIPQGSQISMVSVT
jgi:hypothetical protein